MDNTQLTPDNENIQRSIVKNMHDVYFRQDLEENLITASPSALKIFGYETMEELLSKKTREFWADQKKRKEFNNILKTNSRVDDFEFTAKRKDESTFDVSINCYYFRDQNDSIAGVEGTIRDISKQKKAETALINMADFQRIILNLSTSFVNCSSSQIDPAINYSLEVIGELTNVDRSYVFLRDENSHTMSNTNEWCRAGIKPEKENLQGINFDSFPYWIKKLKDMEHIYIPSVKNIPPERNNEKEILEPQGIKSLLVVPMFYEQNLMGFIGFDSVRSERIWDDMDIQLLQVVGILFANAITRKNTENTLRERESLYFSLISRLPNTVLVHRKGTILYANNTILDESGYSPEEVIGKNVLDFIVEEDKQLLMDSISRRTAGERMRDYEVRIKTKSGIIKSAMVRGETTLFKKEPAAVIILIDITERKAAEEALRKSEERYRLMEENLDDVLWSMDMNLRFTYVSPSVFKMHGYAKSEFLALSLKDIMTEESFKLAEHHFNYFREKVKSGYSETESHSVTLEIEALKKDKNRFWTEIKITPTRDYNGRIVGIQGLTRDISERKKTEALAKAKEAAEIANRAKSDYLTLISHEIKTPLSGIISLSDLAMDQNLNESQMEIMLMISRETNRLFELINDILDLSSIETGRIKIIEVPFDLGVLMDSLSLSFTNRAEQKGLKFLSTISPDVPLSLIGDPGKLSQVLINLITNALKFTQKGGIYVKAELFQKKGEYAKILFSIKDTGIGIPKERKNQLFLEFSETVNGNDKKETKSISDVMLGLAISRKLVELMDGQIGAESHENMGSTFWFTITLKIQEKGDGIDPSKGPVFQNLRVLIADDNKTSRHILKEHICSYGCSFQEVTSEKEVISHIVRSISLNRLFDLIIISLKLHEKEEMGLLYKIRSLKGFENTPIIILTSEDIPKESKRNKGIGTGCYYHRPISRDELHNVIESFISSKQEKELPPSKTSAKSKQGNNNNTRVLLVEDYISNQQVAKRYMEHSGLIVELAENGKLAVDAFKTGNFDLIFMDIQMPVMDGFEATRIIRSIEKSEENYRRIPIIALTAHAVKEYIEKCIDSGMDDFILKPLNRNKIMEILNKWVNHPLEKSIR